MLDPKSTWIVEVGDVRVVSITFVAWNPSEHRGESFSLFPSIGDIVDIYQREFLALRDRLHAAEQESLKRSKELNLVLEEIKRAISEKQALRDINRTWSSLSGE